MGVRPMQGGAGGVGKHSVKTLFFQFSNFGIANGGWRRAPVMRSEN